MRCVLASLCVLLLTTIASAGCPGGFFTVPGASKCFKSFLGRVSWDAAKRKCLSEGLLLAKPSDSIAVELRMNLLLKAKKFPWWPSSEIGGGHWINGRGDGTVMVWQQDYTKLSPNSPLFLTKGVHAFASTKCLAIEVWEPSWDNHPDSPYSTWTCSNNSPVSPNQGLDTLCEGDQIQWSSWSGWTQCSESCGEGNQKRTRECVSSGCTQKDREEETRICFAHNCPIADAAVVPKCGRVNRGTKIVGGDTTEVNEYPWQVGLVRSFNDATVFCGGSIINERWILTAAHCLVEFKETLRVVVGVHSWINPSEIDATQIPDIELIKSHPNYTASNSHDNDIGLIKLAQPLTFYSNNKVAPVCPPILLEPYENVDAIVTGWGATSEGGPLSNLLQEVVVRTMPNRNCQRDYSDVPGRAITANMLCAGIPEGGKDSCQGDSGGPMITAERSIYRQIGVVSWGEGCARPKYPGVYARVNRNIIWEWITKTISGTRWSEP